MLIVESCAKICIHITFPSILTINNNLKIFQFFRERKYYENFMGDVFNIFEI